MDNNQPIQSAPQDSASNGTVPPFDSHRVNGFRYLSEAARENINRDIYTALSASLFADLTAYYRQTVRRDPTVGELRIFDGLTRNTESLSMCVGAGEMLTDSREMADVWKDIMQRRQLLSNGGSEPCTVSDVLQMPQQYMECIGDALAKDRCIFVGHNALLHALQNDMRPVVRVQDENGVPMTVATKVPHREQPVKNGDVLIILWDVPISVLAALRTDSGKQAAVTAEMHPLDETPLLMTLFSSFPGASVKAERLVRREQTDGLAVLCGHILPASHAGTHHVLVRVRADKLVDFYQNVRSNLLNAVVIGQVELNGHITVTYGTYPIADLEIRFLRELSATRLCSIGLPDVSEPIPTNETRSHALFRAHNPYIDLTENSQMSYLPTAADTDAYLFAGTMTAVASECLPACDGTAYRRAMRAVLCAVGGILSQGVDRKRISLSVFLRGKEPKRHTPHSPSTVSDGNLHTKPIQYDADGAQWAAACGLYRAALELCVPIANTNVINDISEGEDDCVTVCAYGQTDAMTVVPAKSVALYDVLYRTEEANPDWAAVRKAADEAARAYLAPAAQNLPHRTVLVPVIPPQNNEAVKELSATLALSRISCVTVDLQKCPPDTYAPVTVENAGGQTPISEESDLPTPACTASVLTRESADEFRQSATGRDSVLLVMSEQDADAVLDDPAVRQVLQTASNVTAVGGVCRALAKRGYLPQSLAETPTEVMPDEKTLTADIIGADGRRETVRIHCAHILTAYSSDIPHRMEIRASNGPVADGFIGDDGRVIGYVNGLPSYFSE